MKSLPIQSLKAHISLNVNDVSESIKFYQKLFGIEPSKVRRGYAKFDVANPPLNLALNEVKIKERGGLSHLGIQVASTEDVMQVREQWINEGLVPRDEMQTNCCYAIQDKTWVADPDGNQWEVFVVLKDNLAETALCCVTDNLSMAKSEQSKGDEVASAATNASSCCGSDVVVGLSANRANKR